MRIYWDEQQKELIAMAAARLEIANPKISFCKLIRDAQEILPGEYRRKIVAIESVPWFREKVMWAHRQIQREAVEALDVPEAPQQPAEPLVEADEESGVIVQAIANELLKKLPEKLADSLADRIADKILEKGLDSMVSKLGDQLLTHLANRMLAATQPAAVAQPVAKLEAEAPAREPDLPVEKVVAAPAAAAIFNPVEIKKVLVVGLLPIQEQTIRNEFGAKVHLDFWKEEGVHKLKSMVKTHDHVIVVADKAGKTAKATIQGAAPGSCKVKWIHGGTTSVSRELQTLIH